MNAAEFCPECNEAVLWKCSSCDRENDKSIHTSHPVESEAPPSTRAASVVGAILTMVSGMSVALTL
ncbi:hypothetical protein NTE_02052 [Candidatus Nitrososphaera evergladensis SR1]|jgi:hypothetical protein|uniref:Uncharacterized protein n=1 Tax=Candidatus Nitrososphaera evergladensis SR1 TaxID=1459636 RepID=A0A075MXT8_9ARCH|nr:hypothetical protein NTE_02052 [Candidatus Nitrososphaera evergladensis SR1]